MLRKFMERGRYSMVYGVYLLLNGKSSKARITAESTYYLTVNNAVVSDPTISTGSY